MRILRFVLETGKQYKIAGSKSTCAVKVDASETLCENAWIVLQDRFQVMTSHDSLSQTKQEKQQKK